MYAIILKGFFLGFSLKEEEGYKNVLISTEEYSKLLSEQSEGLRIYWDRKNEVLKTIKLEAFEYISENGEITKDIEAEQKYYKERLLILKKDKVQLKKDIKNFREFEEDVSELEIELKKKIEEISKIEEILNSM